MMHTTPHPRFSLHAFLWAFRSIVIPINLIIIHFEAFVQYVKTMPRLQCFRVIGVALYLSICVSDPDVKPGD